MHRYRPDTVSVVLNDYLREFRAKLEARKRHLEHVERSGGTTQRDKTQAVKEITRIDKILLLPTTSKKSAARSFGPCGQERRPGVAHLPGDPGGAHTVGNAELYPVGLAGRRPPSTGAI
jgi:hypothetical protein